MRFKRVFWISVGLLWISGCSATGIYYPAAEIRRSGKAENSPQERIYRENIGRLKQQLLSLKNDVNDAEADLLAETAIRESAMLAERYRLIRPARLHNLLVQVGLRDRGLCYHWTEDLMKPLAALHLKTLELHWGVAHRGSDLFEHNSVVVTARGANFVQGMILDPWRNSGNLFWELVAKDPYPWKQLPRAEW